ncbi:hypothetical protein [Allocoleopsis sp.]|uniref:hypothetical protein n=1 Tax=Allocoleopsis sp. TaxID=3088169 RepID=UPI002FCEFE97
MKLNYFTALMPIILAANLFQPITQAQEISSIEISTRIQIESQLSHASEKGSDRKGNAKIFPFARQKSVSVSEKQEPLSPRPSPPGGSR